MHKKSDATWRFIKGLLLPAMKQGKTDLASISHASKIVSSIQRASEDAAAARLNRHAGERLTSTQRQFVGKVINRLQKAGIEPSDKVNKQLIQEHAKRLFPVSKGRTTQQSLDALHKNIQREAKRVVYDLQPTGRIFKLPGPYQGTVRTKSKYKTLPMDDKYYYAAKDIGRVVNDIQKTPVKGGDSRRIYHQFATENPETLGFYLNYAGQGTGGQTIIQFPKNNFFDTKGKRAISHPTLGKQDGIPWFLWSEPTDPPLSELYKRRWWADPKHIMANGQTKGILQTPVGGSAGKSLTAEINGYVNPKPRSKLFGPLAYRGVPERLDQFKLKVQDNPYSTLLRYLRLLGIYD